VARARSAASERNWRRQARILLAVAGGRGELLLGAGPEAASEYLLPGVLADRLVVAGKAL
jgi:hypothetical protein